MNYKIKVLFVLIPCLLVMFAARPTLAQTSTPTPSPSPTSSPTPTATPTVDPSITPHLTPNPIHTPLATPTPYPTMTPWPTATPLTVTNLILPAPFTYTDVLTNITTAPITATPIYIYVFPTPYPTEIIPEPASTPVVCAPSNPVPVEGAVEWVGGVSGSVQGQKYPFQARVLALKKKDIPQADWGKYIFAYNYAISELIISTDTSPTGTGTLSVIYHFQLGVELSRDINETVVGDINKWWRFDEIRKEAVRLYKEDCGKFTVTLPDPIEPEEVTETISLTLTDYVPNWITIPQTALIISGTTNINNNSFSETISQAIPGTNLASVAISITNFFTDCSSASGVYSHYSWAARMLPSNDRKGINGGQIIELAIGDQDTSQLVYYFVNGGIVNNTLGSSTNTIVGAIVAQATAAYTANCPTASLTTPSYLSLNGIVAALLATNVLLDFMVVNTQYISAEITCLEATNTFTLTLTPPTDPIWTGILQPVGIFKNFFLSMGVDVIENAAQQGLCPVEAKYTFLGIEFPYQTNLTPRYYGSMMFSYTSYFYIFKAFLLFVFDYIRSQYWLFKTNLGVVGIFIGWLFMMLPFVISTRLTQALIRFLVGMFNFLFGLAGFAYYLIDLSVNVPWAVFDLLGRLAEWFLAGFWFAWLFVWRLWDFAIESWEAVPDTAQMFLLITGGITGIALILFAFIKPIAAFLLQLAGVIIGGFFILAKALGF